jgi:hypothetical protein
MQKFAGRVFVCFAVLAMNASTGADIINPGERMVNRCATINNINAFPDIVLIGVSVYGSGFTRYRLTQDVCMTKGLRNAMYYLLWAPKAYVDSVGFDSLPIKPVIGLPKRTENASPIQLLSASIEPFGAMVPTSDSRAAEELYYALQSVNGTLSIYLAKKVSIATDSTRRTETFTSSARERTIDRRSPKGMQGSLRVHGYYAFSTDFNGPVTASLFDCTGRMVQSSAYQCNLGATYLFTFASLPSGIYWIAMRTPNGIFTRILQKIG